MRGKIMEENSMVNLGQVWCAIQTFSGYAKTVKDDLLDRAKLYNKVDKIFRV